MFPNGGPGVGEGEAETAGTGFGGAGDGGSGEGEGFAARACPALNRMTPKTSGANANARFINEKPPWVRSSLRIRAILRTQTQRSIKAIAL
jgi:hypothetical protein